MSKAVQTIMSNQKLYAERIATTESNCSALLKRSRETDANVSALESRLAYMGEANKASNKEDVGSLEEFEKMVHKLRKEF